MCNIKIIYKNFTGNGGFSLIELSIIISIAATLAIGYLSWTEPVVSSDAEKSLETRKNIREVIKSIENFVIINGRLPCPADPKVLIDGSIVSGYTNTHNTKFGIEALDIDESGSHETTIKTLGIDCPNNVGIIPINSLGLEVDQMFDGWGRYITYHVADTLCGIDRGADKSGTVTTTNYEFLSPEDSRKKGCTAYDYKTKAGNIIVTSNGSDVISKNAAIVLVSHGANGKGALMPGGSQLSSGTGNELINSDNSGVNLNKYVKTEQSISFDDILYFRTRYQINKNNLNKFNDSRSGSFMLSVDECNENSTALSEFTFNEALSLNANLADYSYQNKIFYGDDLLPDHTYDDMGSGEGVALSILKAMQDACVKYYGYEADVNNGWVGAQCPGNNLANVAENGSTYDAVKGTCSCYDDSWDGTCT